MNSRPVTPAEALEHRRLLSVSIVDHTLLVVGDAHASNNLFIVYSADRSRIIVRVNGKETHVSSSNLTGVKLLGGAGDDALTVRNSRANEFDISCTIIGGGGNDTLVGGDGHNLMIGGDGDDILVGGNQDDTLVGGRGNDTLVAGTASELMFGGEGDDSLVGNRGFDIMFAGDGNDIIKAGSGRSELFGNKGDDVLNVKNDDTVYTGAGADTVIGSVGSRGEIHRAEVFSLSKIIDQLDPKVGRFRTAGGKPADNSSLL